MSVWNDRNRRAYPLGRGLFVLLTALSFGLGEARSAVLLTFSNGGSGVTIDAGGMFTFDVYLTITGAEQVAGYDYFLQALGGGYVDGFSILSRVTDPADFPDANNSDAAVATSPASLLDPSNDLSLGASVADPFQPLIGAGTYLLATVTIASTPGLAPGSYTLSALDAAWFDENFDENPFSAGTDFTVTVNSVPEPSSGVLAGIFLLTAWTVSRRRLR